MLEEAVRGALRPYESNRKMDELTEVAQEEFDRYCAFHHSYRPMTFERTSKGYFYWYGTSLMAAKWHDKPNFYVSTSEYKMFQQGKSLYQKVKN